MILVDLDAIETRRHRIYNSETDHVIYKHNAKLYISETNKLTAALEA